MPTMRENLSMPKRITGRLNGFIREKIHPGLDRIILVLMMAFAVTSVAFPHKPVDTVTGLIIILWLIKLFTGGVRFEKNMLLIAIPLTITLLIFSYLRYKNLAHEDYTQRQMVLPLIWYYVVSSLPFKTKYAKAFLGLSVLAMVGLNGYFFVRHLQVPFTVMNRLSYWGHPNNYSNYDAIFLLTVFVLFLREKVRWRRWTYLSMMLPLMVGMVFTYTRGGWISLLCGLVFLFFFMKDTVFSLKKKMLFVGMTGMLLIIPLLNPLFLERLLTTAANASDQERFMVWKSGLLMFEKSPLVGVGLNMYRHHYMAINHLPYQMSMMHAHNNILHILAELGLLGLAVFTFLFVNLYRVALRLLKKSHNNLQRTLLYIFIGGMTLHLVHGMFDYTFSVRPTMYFLITMLAMATSLQREGEEACP